MVLRDHSKSCLKCGATETSRWRTGPDGPRSLCTRCYHNYRKRRTVVYQGKNGIVSVQQTRGTRPMRIAGFSRRDNGYCNLFRPILEPFLPTKSSSHADHEKKAAVEETKEDPSQGSPCLKCFTRSQDGLYLGPDGASTLCFPCHRKYSCRELPLYKVGTGSITVSRTSAAHRVDHVGFRLSGMQRDLSQPITKPWLGKARVSATVLETKQLRSRVIRRESRLEHSAFKFRKIHRQRRVFGVATSAAIAAGQNSNPAVIVGMRVKGEETAGPQSQHENRGRDFARAGRVAGLAGFVPNHAGETTYGGSDNVTTRGDHLASYRPRSGLAMKASYRVGGMVIVRRFAFDPNLEPEAFIEHLRVIFRLRGNFFIRYRDDSNDDITVSTSAEITELFAVALESSISPVRLDIIPLHDDLSILQYGIVTK